MGAPKGTRPPAAGIGRKPGVPNKLHADVRAQAQSFGPDAIRKLAEMGGLIPGVKPATPNATQAYALDKLLDRAYGKAPQAHSLEGDGELLGVVLIPAKRPVGSRDLAPAPMPQIEGSAVRDAVEVTADAKYEQVVDPSFLLSITIKPLK
jgi:hypothetical protein